MRLKPSLLLVAMLTALAALCRAADPILQANDHVVVCGD